MWIKIGVFVLASSLSLSAQAGKPDAWVTTKTKLALWTTGGIPSTDVDVDTVDGVVTLHGKVETASERTAAEAEAKKIEGVKSVRNLLQVVSSKRQNAVAKDDKLIKEQTEGALRAEQGLSGIKVQSVNAGVVLLGGRADDLADQISAVRIAYNVPGVRRVATEMQGGDQAYMDSVDDAMQSAKSHKSTVKRKMSDGWITTEVKMRLLVDEQVPALDINVDTRDSVVTLFGTIPTSAGKAAAEKEANKVDGVARVVNDLQVVPASRKEVVKAEDKAIERQLKETMGARDDLHDVDVVVKGGVVRLTGNVPSRMRKLEAILVSRSAGGVRGVSNDLTIKRKKD